jgi:basic amino acid/polyamine antiporter, APA family
MTPARQLHRILGLGFGLAFAFGTMVGVGILRLPGMVAGAVGSPALIILCWTIGGLYALMGADSVAELATMYPEAGGLRVFSRRAFGDLAGFVSGWIDWLSCTATIAYGAVTAIEFAATLWSPVAQWQRPAAIAVLGVFGALHAVGLRLGGGLTTIASAAIGILLLALVIGCFLIEPVAQPAVAAVTTVNLEQMSWAAIPFAVAPAMRAILTAYDGWYAPIYTAEECVDTSRTLPRAIVGGTLVVMALYVAINVALLRVLPVPVLATSVLPAADAAQAVLPHGSATLITVLSLLIVLSLINATSIMAPRVLFSLAREGWIPQKAAMVNRGGTPVVALAATMAGASLMILTGSFNEIISLFAVVVLLNYIATFLAVFALRRRYLGATRPYRALGYPVSTAIVLVGSVAFLATAVVEDWRSAVTAVVFLSMCVPAYALAARSRRVSSGPIAVTRG